eukprot:TRINITY_DN2457_c0_g1_i3.p3 TRINITY_DN2457_c0_g1~~TRINITY_DN2457_c0_g1_i3.p3  ORF type:complete len:159 (+),score=5.95 TRINITY_DN2457_c0_g1_i3:191-667(+)
MNSNDLSMCKVFLGGSLRVPPNFALSFCSQALIQFERLYCMHAVRQFWSDSSLLDTHNECSKNLAPKGLDYNNGALTAHRADDFSASKPYHIMPLPHAPPSQGAGVHGGVCVYISFALSPPHPREGERSRSRPREDSPRVHDDGEKIPVLTTFKRCPL